MKLDKEQMLNNLLCFLGQDEGKTYMMIRMHHHPSDWDELKQMFVDHYHETVYGRTFSYLTIECPKNSTFLYAKKKCEVLRCYLKSISDGDLIQLISWSLPYECQKAVMPNIYTNLNSFLSALEKYQEEFDKEEAESENMGTIHEEVVDE